MNGETHQEKLSWTRAEKKKKKKKKTDTMITDCTDPRIGSDVPGWRIVEGRLETRLKSTVCPITS
jgi:hypothetical protein